MIKDDVVLMLQKDRQLFNLADICSDDVIDRVIALMLDCGRKHLTEDKSQEAVKRLVSDTLCRRVPSLDTLQLAMEGLNSCRSSWDAAKIWSDMEPAQAEKLKTGWSLALAAAGLVAMAALALRSTDHKRQKGIFQNIYRCWHSVEMEYGALQEPLMGELNGRDRRVNLSVILTELAGQWLQNARQDKAFENAKF
jgi:hypothetical protein